MHLSSSQEDPLYNLLIVSELREAAKLEEIYYSERQKIFDFVRPRIAEEYNLPKELTLVQMSSIYYEENIDKKVFLLIEYGDFPAYVKNYLEDLEDEFEIYEKACDLVRIETIKILSNSDLFTYSGNDLDKIILNCAIKNRSDELLEFLNTNILHFIIFDYPVEDIKWILDCLNIPTNKYYISNLSYAEHKSLEHLKLILERAQDKETRNEMEEKIFKKEKLIESLGKENINNLISTLV